MLCSLQAAGDPPKLSCAAVLCPTNQSHPAYHPLIAVSLGASVGAAGGMLIQSGLEAASGIGAHGSVLGMGADDAQVRGHGGRC